MRRAQFLCSAAIRFFRAFRWAKISIVLPELEGASFILESCHFIEYGLVSCVVLEIKVVCDFKQENALFESQALIFLDLCFQLSNAFFLFRWLDYVIFFVAQVAELVFTEAGNQSTLLLA